MTAGAVANIGGASGFQMAAHAMSMMRKSPTRRHVLDTRDFINITNILKFFVILFDARVKNYDKPRSRSTIATLHHARVNYYDQLG